MTEVELAELLELRAFKAGVEKCIAGCEETIAAAGKRWADRADTSALSNVLYNLRLDIARFTAEARGEPTPQQVPVTEAQAALQGSQP